MEAVGASNLADVSTLAMVYAELGRFDRAVDFQRAAVEAASDAPRATLHRERRRLELYLQGVPCRNPWERNERLHVLESIEVRIKREES